MPSLTVKAAVTAIMSVSLWPAYGEGEYERLAAPQY
jgi:hypothetical protein